MRGSEEEIDVPWRGG